MIEYSILSLLPETAGSIHQELRLQIEQQFHLGGPIELPVPSHITLKYRFPVEDMETLDSALQAFCQTQVPTEWSLRGFGNFTNSKTPVIFMKVIPSQAARESHSRMLNSLRSISWMHWGLFDHADLQYHVTLASKGLSTDNFEAVWSFVNQYPFPTSDIYFDNLALLEIDEGKPSIYKQYPLIKDTKYGSHQTVHQ